MNQYIFLLKVGGDYIDEDYVEDVDNDVDGDNKVQFNDDDMEEDTDGKDANVVEVIDDKDMEEDSDGVDENVDGGSKVVTCIWAGLTLFIPDPSKIQMFPW